MVYQQKSVEEDMMFKQYVVQKQQCELVEAYFLFAAGAAGEGHGLGAAGNAALEAQARKMLSSFSTNATKESNYDHLECCRRGEEVCTLELQPRESILLTVVSLVPDPGGRKIDDPEDGTTSQAAAPCAERVGLRQVGLRQKGHKVDYCRKKPIGHAVNLLTKRALAHAG